MLPIIFRVHQTIKDNGVFLPNHQRQRGISTKSSKTTGYFYQIIKDNGVFLPNQNKKYRNETENNNNNKMADDLE
jgi:hypothetical protein